VFTERVTSPGLDVALTPKAVSALTAAAPDRRPG
jgi:hypothetical protein